METSGTALYLYCIAPPSPLPGLVEGGVGGSPVLTRSAGNLTAVLSEVPAGDFCDAEADSRLRDLSWVGPRACRHAAVIEEVMRHSPVLPVGFPTLFGSEASLRTFLLSRRDRITGFFVWLGNRREWGVKGIWDREQAGAGSGGDQAPPDTSPGAGFLRQKRGALSWAAELDRRLREACRDAARELQAAANGFRERGIVNPAEGRSHRRVVLNWAFVLPPGAEEDFGARVDEINRRGSGLGLTFHLTGPWPPYSFAPALSDADAT